MTTKKSKEKTAEVEFQDNDEIEKNPVLEQPVQSDTPLKKWLVDYVGENVQPENEEVTVEHIVSVISEEFPEFLLAVAEENFIRGYNQAFTDIEAYQKDLNAQPN